MTSSGSSTCRVVLPMTELDRAEAQASPCSHEIVITCRGMLHKDTVVFHDDPAWGGTVGGLIKDKC